MVNHKETETYGKYLRSYIKRLEQKMYRSEHEKKKLESLRRELADHEKAKEKATHDQVSDF